MSDFATSFPRFGSGVARFGEVLGPAAWGLEVRGPSLSDLERAAGATGDPVVEGAARFLREIDVEGLMRRGLVRLPRTYREVYSYPRMGLLPRVDPNQVHESVRFAGAGVAPEGLALYVDIPFCERACRYCATRGANTGSDREPVRRYLDSLEKELRLVADRFGGDLPPFTCVYVGGGTGSYLELDEVARVLQMLEAILGVTPDVPKTLEGDPTSSPPEKVKALVGMGFDAYSLGIEAFEPHLLEVCNRAHDVALAEERIVGAMEAGMAHLNIDLIIGLPDQSLADVCHMMEQVGRLAPGAVTLYSLRIHEGSSFYRMAEERFPTVPVVYLMQAVARRYLRLAGYHRSEGNRWVLDPAWKHAQHTHTRRGGCHLGVGTRATTHVERLAWMNTNVTPEYEDCVDRGVLPLKRLGEVDELQWMLKLAVAPLKLAAGLQSERFARRFGCEVEDVFGEPFSALCDLGLLARTDDGYAATEAGAIFEPEMLAYIEGAVSP